MRPGTYQPDTADLLRRRTWATRTTSPPDRLRRDYQPTRPVLPQSGRGRLHRHHGKRLPDRMLGGHLPDIHRPVILRDTDAGYYVDTGKRPRRHALPGPTSPTRPVLLR